MAEDASNEVEETEESTTQEAQEAEGESTEEPQGTANEQDSEDDLPEWAKKELSKVRKEAAERRVQSKEMAEALKAAVSPEEHAKVIKDFEEKVQNFERELTLSKYTIPEDLMPLLDGKTAEQIEALAPTLQKYAKTDTTKAKKDLDDLSGGLDPKAPVEGDELTAEEVALRIPRRR